jgi:hypothetical protein
MGARTIKLNSARSRSGDSKGKISRLTGLTIDEVKERHVRATGLSPEKLRMILKMKQEGQSLEQIRQESRVELEVLKRFLTDPDAGKIYSRSPPIMTEDTKKPHKPQTIKTLPKPQQSPTFLYCCEAYSKRLSRVNLLTGEQSWLEVPKYEFKLCCCWSELPGGSLLITGGFPPVREVLQIDTLREYAVSSQPPMHTPRENHAAVYHSQYLYVLAGYNSRDVRECERYSCAERRWEVLPALPVGGGGMSAVEVDNSLYALGGYERDNTVQKLSLDSLTWELMQLKLPQTAYWAPCFKTDTQICLILKETLYSFSPLQVIPIKTLPESISCGSSYYSRGTLYYERGRGVESLTLGI